MANNHLKLLRNLQQYATVLSCYSFTCASSANISNTSHYRITGIRNFKLLSQSKKTPGGGGGGGTAAGTKMTDALSQVADVDIDPHGTFKYVLIRVFGPSPAGGEEAPSKLIVRGYQRASYHVDIYEEVQAKTVGVGLEFECEGGGRIKHDREEKRLLVYGYSQGFGRANHQLAVDLLKVKYPDYEVTWTNDGY